MSAIVSARCNSLPLPNPTNYTQVRHRGWFGWGSKKDENVPPPSSESRSITDMLKSSPKVNPALQPTFTKGDIAKTSIFDEETNEEDAKGPIRSFTDEEYLSVVDPNRAHAWSWPKRFEDRQHRKRGRLTRTMKIMQTERSHTLKSHWIKTSVKKLAPLARQISGMRLNDAIVQMRFSPKKASTDVMGVLAQARMEAIVQRNMSPEEMYVSQAWVGRGTYEREMNHRARGRIDMLYKPYTSTNFLVQMLCVH